MLPVDVPLFSPYHCGGVRPKILTHDVILIRGMSTVVVEVTRRNWSNVHRRVGVSDHCLAAANHRVVAPRRRRHHHGLVVGGVVVFAPPSEKTIAGRHGATVCVVGVVLVNGRYSFGNTILGAKDDPSRGCRFR